MESDLITLRLITSKNEVKASPTISRGSPKIRHYEHSSSPETRDGFDPQGLHPDFNTRSSETLEPVGDTALANSFLQAVFEDGQDAGERCASKSNIHLDLLLDTGIGENPGPDNNDEDDIMTDAIRNSQSEIIYESLLRREKAILRGCDALIRRFRFTADQGTATIVDREDATVRTDKVRVSMQGDWRSQEFGFRVWYTPRVPFLFVLSHPNLD